MIDILNVVNQAWHTGRKVKKSSSGWQTANGPCCVHNGESQDKRGRCGVIFSSEGYSVHCFNCGFKVKFVLGSTITHKARKFLSWIGIEDSVITQMSLDSIRTKNPLGTVQQQVIPQRITFKSSILPKGSRKITLEDLRYSDYIESRGINVLEKDFYIIPNEKNRPRFLVPFEYKNKVVGWASRYIDNKTPKYKNDNLQQGFLFGMDNIKEEHQHVIVCEGLFDAISINGVAVLSNELTEFQSKLLKQTGKNVIIVPDQDKSGIKLAEQGIEEGFTISIPKWDNDVKDINDAVIRYGKLQTLLQIMLSAESNKIKIKMNVNKLKTRLGIKPRR